ncbi:hypothetical protein C806_03009 [Lachnospiraceae bacterium 3-1]|nr:hypothetical protein C806_03009 [Lachnospiraceae bacterium 3-1]
MNERQKAFADYYIECGNATESARRAGYKQPKQQGSRLLTNVDLLEYIKSRAALSEQKRIASGDEVLQFFTRVMYGEEEGVSMPDRIKAGREILKRDIADKKLEIELLKLESRQGEEAEESDMDDAMLDALNASAIEVWGGGEDGGAVDGCAEKEDSG